MIYTTEFASDHIRQGDIFAKVPKIQQSLKEFVLYNGQTESLRYTSWVQLAEASSLGQNQNILTAVKPVCAIVISQDCDCENEGEISLCEIRPIATVDRSFEEKNVNSKNPAKWWANAIPQQAIKNLKWFYLPPDPAVDFAERMAVDFTATICLPADELRELAKSYRKCRLTEIAYQHFRERLAHFFRRYPNDEWYPLNRDEFKEYNQLKGGNINPFSWQQELAEPE